MKLVGYLNNDSENAFQTPVYADHQGHKFTHVTDERYNILSFEEISVNQNFKPLYLSKKFRLHHKAAIVFVGKEGYIHYSDAPSAIEEIIHYLNDHSEKFPINAILDEAMLLKNRIFSDHLVVDQFVMKMRPQSEEIILSFDFPAPAHKNSLAQEISVEAQKSETSRNNAAIPLQESENEFAQALRQLKSADMNFELKLKLRSAERRSKLKMFNYQFKLNQNSRQRKNVE